MIFVRIIRAKTVDNRKTTTPEKDIEEKQIQLLKDLIKMVTFLIKSFSIFFNRELKVQMK